MNIAAYAITKNIAPFAQQWMDALNNAKLPVYVLDHSTDGTADILKKNGAWVSTWPIKPWSFDRGKNFAAAMPPLEDFKMVLNVDGDEIVQPCIKDLITQIKPETTRVRHLYQPDNKSPRLREDYRIHNRHYEWHLPIHEILRPRCAEVIQNIPQNILVQHPDPKRKHTWTAMLEKAVQEYPTESRLAMMAGRDFYFDKKYKSSLVQFERFVTMADASSFDRSYAYGMIAKCCEKLKKNDEAFVALTKAAKEPQARREAQIELAHWYLKNNLNEKAMAYASQALSIQYGEYAAHYDPGAWTFKPFEILMLASFELRQYAAARDYGIRAVSCVTKPQDRARIQGNLRQLGAAT